MTGSRLAAALMLLASHAAAQKPGPAKDAPPVITRPDLTGWWVAVVSEDWRFRMVTPGPGEYAGIPLNAAAKAVADAWNPARDEAAGEQCRGYGAAALMRVPGRLHITQVDKDTLKVEMDNGRQTRLLHLGGTAPADAAPSWQGYSAATWDDDVLKVVTTGLRPSYLRKNGVPYSARTTLTEYWDAYGEPDGSQRLVITSLVDDPVYLQDTYAFSPIFRREPNGAKWDPTQCSAQ